jgi:hypothetical protein
MCHGDLLRYCDEEGDDSADIIDIADDVAGCAAAGGAVTCGG